MEAAHSAEHSRQRAVLREAKVYAGASYIVQCTMSCTMQRSSLLIELNVINPHLSLHGANRKITCCKS